MKKVLSAIALVILMSPLGYASEFKVGLIDVQRALNESEAGKKAKVELEEIVKKRQTEIDQRVIARERLAEEIDRQALVLKSGELEKKQDELEKLERDIQRFISDSNTEVQKKQKEKEMAILHELDGIITGFGKEQGYTIIMPAEAVLYSSEGFDITQSIIDIFDSRMKETKGAK